MNRFWDIVIRPCLEAIESKNIVEIGSDNGYGTKNLIKYCEDVQGTITSIDPFPKYNNEEWEKEHEGIFKLYKDLSLNRLPLLKDYDAILVDGDHNWYTVYNELKIIQKTFEDDTLPLILLHDIDWPYARRDLYYNPDNIPVGYRQAYAKKGMLPDELNLVDEGGLNDHLNNAIYENNPQNGVRTAIEDFIKEFTDKDRIGFLAIPGFFGLGIIYDKKKHENILKVINDETVKYNIMHKIEAERVDWIIKHKDLNVENKQIKKENKELIKEKKVLLEKQQELIEERGKLTDKQQELIEEREKLIDKQQELVEENEKLADKQQELVEEKEKLADRQQELVEENRKLLAKKEEQTNKILYIEKEKEIQRTELDKHEELVTKLKVTLKKRDNTIRKLNKDISTHLNSIRYRIGDAVVKGAHPSINTIKLPFRLIKLFREGNKKKVISVEQNSNPNVYIETNKELKVNSKIEENNKHVNEIYEHKEDVLKRFNYNNFETDLKQLMRDKVNIIIPIYNAFEEVKECITSVIEHTKFPYKLTLIDDCSPDSRIRQLLSEYEDKHNIQVIYNKENIGYVSTINKAIKATAEGDILLLNSDTKVTEKWLTKIVIAALQDKKVGTVTPFSNAAGAFSVPIMGENKDIPEQLTLREMNRIVEEKSKYAYVEVPTGNGFCMYIKRILIDDIGLFDDITFTKGYGEENDFCMRALKKGWKNIIEDSTYIYHKRSASFSEAKDQLIKENREKLDELHPDYKTKISVFKNNESLIEIREKIGKSVDEFSTSNKFYKLNKNILYVLHEAGGGTPNTNKDLMSIVSNSNYTTYVLTSNGKTLKLGIYKENQINEITQWNLTKPWNVDMFKSEEYRNIYFDILYNLKIDVLHVRHLIKHSFDIIDVANVLNIPIIMSFHDFYYICPSIHLLDKEGHYCGENCPRGKKDCNMSPEIKIEGNVSNWVQDVWRLKVSEILEKCDAFVTTSNYSKELYVKVYPMLGKAKFYNIEHGRDFDYEPLNPLEFYAPNDKIKVLLPGNIGFNKGSKFISKLIEYDKEKRIEFHVLGKYDKNLQGDFINHGPYERDEFIDKVKMIKPNFVAVISIWPETYCHTLTEAWSCGIPAIVSDIGTLRERALDGGAILIDHTNIEETYNKIIEAYEIEKYKLLCIQALERTIRSINSMAVEYLKLYKAVKSRQTVNVVYVFKSSKDTDTRNTIVDNFVLNENSYICVNPNINEICIKNDVEANVFIFIAKGYTNEEKLNEIISIKQKYPQLRIITELDEKCLSDNELDSDSEQLEKIKLLKDICLISDKVVSANEKILEDYKKNTEKKSVVIKKIPSKNDLYKWKEVFTDNENSI